VGEEPVEGEADRQTSLKAGSRSTAQREAAASSRRCGALVAQGIGGVRPRG
jgi:hypothetical protein